MKCNCSTRVKETPSVALRNGANRSLTLSGSCNAKKSRMRYPCSLMRSKNKPLLELPLIERLLGAAMARGAEFAEVYVEKATSTAVSLDEGKIKSAQSGSVTGVGVRAIRGAQVGYAYSDDLDEPALLRTAQTAALIADGTHPEQGAAGRFGRPRAARRARDCSPIDLTMQTVARQRRRRPRIDS